MIETSLDGGTEEDTISYPGAPGVVLEAEVDDDGTLDHSTTEIESSAMVVPDDEQVGGQTVIDEDLSPSFDPLANIPDPDDLLPDVPDPDDLVPDWLPVAGGLAVLLVVGTVLAYAWGQLFNVNVGSSG